MVGKGGVSSKDFDKIKTMMQITMSANDHEALAALRLVNRMLERYELRWDEWLPLLKVVSGNTGNGADYAKTHTGTQYRGQSTWDYDTGQQRKRERQKGRNSWGKPNKVKWEAKFPPGEDKIELGFMGVKWVKSIYYAAKMHGGLHARSRGFIEDYYENIVYCWGENTMVSEKQYAWLKGIEGTLSKMGAFA